LLSFSTFKNTRRGREKSEENDKRKRKPSEGKKQKRCPKRRSLN
jgi:hypothetical protein